MHYALCYLSLQDVPPLKFAIFFAGALIRDRNLSYIYKDKVTLPSIHIIGDRDYVKEVGLAASNQLSHVVVVLVHHPSYWDV